MNAQPEKSTILVVDDEPQVLRAIQGLLKDDFVVLANTDGESALRLLEQEEVAVILSDQRMPGLTGDQFLKEAQSRSQAVRMLITGYANLDALVKAVNDGKIYAYVAKPWDPVALRATVRKAVDHYKLTQENQRLTSELLQTNTRLQTVNGQQAAVVELGQCALEGTDLSALMDRAVSLVAQALDVEHGKILELLPDGSALRLRAGVGWKEGYVGHALVGVGNDSQAGYTLVSNEPVIVEDCRAETRFSVPALLRDHGVVSGVSVIITGQERPFGVLGADTVQRRVFSQDDIHFLRLVANVLSEAIERKKAEEKHARLAMAVEQAAESIVITERDGTILYVNPAFERVTGYSREDAIGQNPRLLKSGKHDAAFYRGMWATLIGGEVWSGHLFNKRKDGSLYEEEATITPIRDPSGKVINFVAVKRDVTQEVSLEQQLVQAQKMEAVGTLAGGVAHDFNNLLTTIIGFAQMAEMEPEGSSRWREYVSKIPKQGMQAAGLISQLLTFSRKTHVERQVLSLPPLVKETAKMLERTVSEKIAIRVRCSGEVWRVNADPTQMQQVLLNLSINAGHAMPEGGELTIGLENITLDEAYCRQYIQAHPGDYVCLSVRDTGGGMTPEVRARIFEPFFTTKKQGEGTGLGLAMVYGIVKGHEGHVNVYSEVGVGSEFRVYLPAVREGSSPRVSPEQENPVGGTETLLLVEDDDRVRAVGQKMLERLGYTVLTAANGEGAMEVYRACRDRIALVLTDMTMPKMGGRGLHAALKQIDPAIRVLLMSGYSLGQDVADMEKEGLRGYLQKPLEFVNLSQMVRRALDA